MKPKVIIAISVGLSVVAVIGVLVAWQGIAMWQAQIAFDEYQESVEKEQMRIVQNVNNLIDDCIEKFAYGNVESKNVCEERALEQWSDQIWRLDEEHKGMIKSATTYEEYEIYLGKIRDNYQTGYVIHDDLYGLDLDQINEIYTNCLNGDVKYGTNCDRVLNDMTHTYCSELLNTTDDYALNICKNKNHNEIRNMERP